MTEEQKPDPYHTDTVALQAAFDIEKIFEQLHIGGRAQLLAKIQCTVRDAMLKAGGTVRNQ